MAVIGVSVARRNALAAANQPIPQSVTVEALVDTGASGTCVDPSVLDQLSLSPTGQVQVNTPSTGAQPVVAYQYDVSLLIKTTETQQPLYRPAMPVLSSELIVRQGFHVLIGRDVLQHCLLTYDGRNGLFSLAY